MKWAKLDGIDSKNYLLYRVLMWVIAPYSNLPVDHRLKNILGAERGGGGDPGWEIECIENVNGNTDFRVWADQDISCLDDEELIYDSATFYKAVQETLEAYAVAHPARAGEIAEIIKFYGLDLIKK
ncbi:hypothetical protein GTP81_31365 [Rugamonas sp. FT107W]|uniref:CDI immunity protein domain-containing protein n=1 Tax=Duganella vulcania TaxID=2692166 RepID=A0A845HWW3_9BURK|nr:hypothetical protein [Duganella vulcania]MYN21244.1 hypothetical protein [Duganella vulcania]